MHFQRIVQQNNENENVASIKQCFIVRKILLLSQAPRKSAQHTITAAWREREPYHWSHPLPLAREDLRLSPCKSFCVLLICICFNSIWKKENYEKNMKKVAVYRSSQCVCVFFKFSRVAQIKYCSWRTDCLGGNPLTSCVAWGKVLLVPLSPSLINGGGAKSQSWTCLISLLFIQQRSEGLLWVT